MKTETLEKIEPGNPFLSDLFHMGHTIGKNVVVMYGKPESDEQPYIIICNTTTGERIRIDLTDEAKKASAKAELFDEVMKVDQQERQDELFYAAQVVAQQTIMIRALQDLLRLYMLNTKGGFGN